MKKVSINLETLELIYSFSNVRYLPTERTKTDHLNKIRGLIEKEFPDLQEAL